MAAVTSGIPQPLKEEVIVRFKQFRSIMGVLVASSALALAACGGESESANTNKPKKISQAPIPKLDPTPKVDPTPIRAPELELIEPAVEPVPEPMPTSYGALLKEGKKVAKAGDSDRALEMFEKARSLKPKRGKPYVEIARVHIEQGNMEEARKVAVEAVELAPNWSTAWNTLGRVELAEGDLEAAATSFERATEANEDNSWAWNNLGFVLIQQKEYEQAAEALERATSGDNVTAYMWNNLGMAYEHMDRIVEGRAAYEKGAEGGSKLAAQHLERLDGVTSIAKTDDDSDDDSTVE
jgi:Flp pilus assembly protein TadD